MLTGNGYPSSLETIIKAGALIGPLDMLAICIYHFSILNITKTKKMQIINFPSFFVFKGLPTYIRTMLSTQVSIFMSFFFLSCFEGSLLSFK